ncbi:hypothetical protein, partial [Arachidicoccus sp.]|uniref:hypothetical protein n=1 Tax=Arachidicoccus sp. TaxID=1872624 RepID=UPI003D24C697
HNYTEPKLFLDKLYNDGLVNFQENENAYQINLQGIEFINKGGYTSRTKDSKLKNFWSIIKIIAIALNAIVLIIFAYFSFKKDRYEMGNQNKVQIEKSDSLKKAQ